MARPHNAEIFNVDSHMQMQSASPPRLKFGGGLKRVHHSAHRRPVSGGYFTLFPPTSAQACVIMSRTIWSAGSIERTAATLAPAARHISSWSPRVCVVGNTALLAGIL